MADFAEGGVDFFAEAGLEAVRLRLRGARGWGRGRGAGGRGGALRGAVGGASRGFERGSPGK